MTATITVDDVRAAQRPSGVEDWPAGALPDAYPPFVVPPYRTVERAGWRVLHWNGPAAAHGYFTGQQVRDYDAFGLMRTNGEAWMTLTPIEIESQWPHLHAARGHVLVGGLGMACMAHALTCKPEVTHVTVVEQDADLIDLAPDFAGIGAWAHRDKLTIHRHDMLTYRPKAPVDFLYVDIWRGYRAEPKIAQMRAIQATVAADRVGYWGQEVDAVDWWTDRGAPAESFDATAFEAFKVETGLPLIGLEVAKYPALCRAAAANPNIADAESATRVLAADGFTR